MTPEVKSTSYLSAAKLLFDILKQDYQDNGIPRVFMGSTNYWMAGNVFDTALDYMLLAMANNMITQQEIDSVLAYVNKNYDRSRQSYNANYDYYKNDNGIPSGDISGPASPTGWWYDDYAWWGIASAKAYIPAYQTIFQNHISQFDAIARSCWNVVENGIKVDSRPAQFGAPNVWANCDQQKFATVEPRIPGGVWQCDINDDKNPFNEILGPFQDTVVNGLYLVLALRMNKALNTSAQINREYKFLTTWCFDNKIDVNQRLFYYFPNNSGGLVLERVSTYKNEQPVRPEWWHEVQTSWCGDQGLMLGAMVDFRKTNPDEPARRLIEGIIQGVPGNMQLNSILLPWYPLTDNPLEGTDKADYASGVGVYMRYLLYAYKNSPTVKGWVDSNKYGIKDMILYNADTCVNGNFPKYGNGIFDLFNRLSILITAATILQGADEAVEADNSADYRRNK